MSIQNALGTKDLNPQEVELNQQITTKLACLYTKWGYEEVCPPKVERMRTLIAGGGISNKDIIKIVADEPLGLRPEMTANVVITTGTRKNVITIPKSAIKRSGKKTFTVMEDDGKLIDRSVDLGWRDGKIIEVVSGLNEGEQVGIPKKPISKKKKRRRRR